MVSSTSLLLVIFTTLGALAAPPSIWPDLITRGGTPSSQGTHEGFFYSWWSDGGANATYTNGPDGQFSINWTTGGNLLGGKGWNPGSTTRVINYAGSFEADRNSYLAVYGWMRNPLIEYYIIERYGTYNPLSGATAKGNLTIDGGVYNLGESIVVFPASGILRRYWSVRHSDDKRTSGSVDVGAHFRAWEGAGLKLGALEYQILVCEGYFSTGSCDMTVSEGIP